MAVDPAGKLYIADTGNSRIRLVSGGIITTVAGIGVGGFGGDGGPATSAYLGGPQGVAVDSGYNLYIADTATNLVRKVSGGAITTVAGSGYIPPLGPVFGRGKQGFLATEGLPPTHHSIFPTRWLWILLVPSTLGILATTGFGKY